MSPAEPEPRADDVWRRRARKAVGPVFGLLVVVAIFVAILPQIASYDAVWEALTNLGLTDWGVILVSVAANVATSGPPWMAAVPGLSYRRAMLMTQTTTLFTTVLPLGEAVGIATQVKMLSGWKFRGQAITAGLVLVTLWNQTINVALPVAAVAALGPSGDASGYVRWVSILATVALVILIGVLVYAFRADSAAERLGNWAGRVVTAILKLVRRGPASEWGPRLVRLRHETIGVISSRWHVLTLASLINQLTLFAVLYTCLRSIGIHGVSPLEALAAWSFTRLLASVPITPGGLGITELGMTAALVGFGGGRTAVVTAVLLYRVLTFVPTVLVGSVCALIWRHEDRSLHLSALED